MCLAQISVNTQFFARLGEGGGMNYNRHVFAGLYEDVQRYCGSWWHRNKATLRRKYFGSPWSAISFIVAALVVALTVLRPTSPCFPGRDFSIVAKGIKEIK